MTPLQNLYTLLQSLQVLLVQLADILQQERNAIVNLNTAETEKQEVALTDLFSKIEPLNREISTAVTAACISAAVVGEKNIATLVTFLPRPEREKLITLQSSVRAKAVSVNNALVINRNLLQDSVHFTTQSLQMFTDALRQTSCTTYGEKGRFISVPEQPHIICKEI